MEPKGLRLGHFLGLLGAFAALTSLWRPWYTVDVPQQLRDVLSNEGAKSSGALGQVMQGLVAVLPDRISASGWQALQGADVAICLGAIAAAALVVGAAGAFGGAIRVDALAAGRGLAVLAAGGLVLVIVHLLHRPLDSDLVHPAGGLWIALAGCGVGLIGGLMAMQPADVRSSGASAEAFPRLEPELPDVFAPAPSVGTARASVPPPA
jgi:hypothetical protein